MDKDFSLPNLPPEPLPAPPDYHVEDEDGLFCQYGFVGVVGEDIHWIACSCEDPENPWAPRKVTDGPKDCMCYHCGMKERSERGRQPCEYADHHCDGCHPEGRCTTINCLAEFKGTRI